MSNLATVSNDNKPAFSLMPTTFAEALTFSKHLADSEMVPKDFKGKPANCLIAMQWGAELGLKPLQAMQNIAVINGRPSLWGDAVIALVRSSAVCEYIIESSADTAATCKVKRRGEPEQERTFSVDDAKKAGLWGKQGPWAQYPKRMLQMRARAFAVRDVFPDVLKGLQVAEEVMDIPTKTDSVIDASTGEVLVYKAPKQEPPKELPLYSDEQFDTNYSSWQKAIAEGKITAEQIVAKIKSKYRLEKIHEDYLLTGKVFDSFEEVLK